MPESGDSHRAKRQPAMVFAGHVHNYRRLTKSLTNGGQLPYLVTGAGGYHNLHSIIKVDGQKMITPVAFTDKSGDTVTLERYCDDHHGFLRLELTDKLITGAISPCQGRRSPSANRFR